MEEAAPLYREAERLGKAVLEPSLAVLRCAPLSIEEVEAKIAYLCPDDWPFCDSSNTGVIIEDLLALLKAAEPPNVALRHRGCRSHRQAGRGL